jgi:hypothetical protein
MQLRGLAGTDVTINAPLGVTVLTDEGEVLGDLTANNQTITVAQGTGLLVTPIFLQMILYGGIGINKLQFLIEKNINFFQLFFSSCIFGHQNPGSVSGSGSRGQCITEQSDPNPEVLGDPTTKNQTITVAQGTGLLVALILFYK